MKKIIVIFGGISPEHDVSIITGCLAVNSLDKSKFQPVPVYVNKKGEWFTGEKLKNLGFYKEYSEKKLTRVTLSAGENVLHAYAGNKPLFSVAGAINCMHGGSGENGTIGALFELCNIPCATTDTFTAKMAMDKTLTKIVLKNSDVEVVPYKKIMRNEFYKDSEKAVYEIAEGLGLPVIVKPASTGSSIGISVAKSYEELQKSLIYALRFDEKAIVEKYIEDFTEVNCAAYLKDGNVQVSELEKPVFSHPILTFEDKYSGGKGGYKKREFPAKVSDRIREKVREITGKVYTEFGFSSIVRMDYIVKGETVYLNEINTVPGSLAYYLFYDKISGLTDLLTDLLEEAFKKSLSKKGSISEFDSDILSFKGVALKK